MTPRLQFILWFSLAAMVALLTGCSAQWFAHPLGGKRITPEQMTTNERDRNHFNAPDAARFNPAFAQRTASLSALPAPKMARIQADPVTADGYNLYGGTKLDRSDWSFRATSSTPDFTVLVDKPGEWFGLKAYFRNGIDGSQTESGWATR